MRNINEKNVFIIYLYQVFIRYFIYFGLMKKSVEVGSTTTGEIEIFHDEDWLKVDLIAGNSYLFSARC